MKIKYLVIVVLCFFGSLIAVAQDKKADEAAKPSTKSFADILGSVNAASLLLNLDKYKLHSEEYNKSYQQYIEYRQKRDALEKKCAVENPKRYSKECVSFIKQRRAEKAASEAHQKWLLENCTTNDGFEWFCDNSKLVQDKPTAKDAPSTTRSHEIDDDDINNGKAVR